MNNRKKEHGEAGQALVEFALVLPVFLLVLFGIIELGWMEYQEISFTQGVAHAAWDVSADQLGDHDAMTGAGSHKSYSGASVQRLVADAVAKNSLWAFQRDNLTVRSATATLYNDESTASVPGIRSGETTEARAVTRYMELRAEISYKIDSVTGLGSWFFRAPVELTREIECKRMVGAERRSE